jgi:Na+-driven multidrug efflux pump
MTSLYMLCCATVFVAFSDELMRLFTRDEHVIRIGRTLLVFAAVYQLFDAMYVIYNGALRGAGDTLVPAVVTAALCWGITVGLGYFIARTWPHWGVVGPWGAATFYGVVLGVYLLPRHFPARKRSSRYTPRSRTTAPNPLACPGLARRSPRCTTRTPPDAVERNATT